MFHILVLEEITVADKNDDGEYDTEKATEEGIFDHELIEQEFKEKCTMFSLLKGLSTFNAKTSLEMHMKGINLSIKHICDICGIDYKLWLT